MQSHRIIPAEIKATSTFTGNFLEGIIKSYAILPGRIEGGFIVYSGSHEMKVQGVQLENFKKHRTINIIIIPVE